jgi:hypothetical protein
VIISSSNFTYKKWRLKKYYLQTVLHFKCMIIDRKKLIVAQLYCLDITFCGQAIKGCWWMPWHQQAKKDVITYDMLRGAGKKR